jgi:hypothetical protein
MLPNQYQVLWNDIGTVTAAVEELNADSTDEWVYTIEVHPSNPQLAYIKVYAIESGEFFHVGNL